MYIAMAKPIKIERVNIRIEADVKRGGNIVAEMESRTLSSLITDFLRKSIEAARKDALPAFEEAAKRLDAAAKAARNGQPTARARTTAKKDKRRKGNNGSR